MMSRNERITLTHGGTEPAGAASRGQGRAPRSVGTRLLSLGALSGTGAGLLWLAVAIIRVFTDSWIAPLALSPDSEAVLSLSLDLTRQRAEIGRVEAEVERYEAELAAIDSGLTRLRGLRDRGRAMYEYGADLRGSEAASLAEQVTHLREERVILERLITRQRTEAEHARVNLGAGLIERRDAEREEQGLDNLLLRRAEIERSLADATARRRDAHEAAEEFRAELHGAPSEAGMPEIVAREEADVRLEVEILRLEAERRGLVALIDVGGRSLEELRAVMAQIEARPAFRATTEALDVAFVPYEQLDGVRPGARILDCEMGIFACRDVGAVSDVLAGEVVTQDPWGELARGRYAVLALHDDTAVQERILRVR